MTAQERREFEKYLKFLTSKAVQVVVQSHDGTKTKTRSNPKGTDWFNLVLNDNRDVISELRHSVDPPYPQDGCPVKVQITMETPEGDSFVAEIWEIILNARKRDITVSVSHLLYPRLSLLLKSVLSVSRCIPSYHLSKKHEDLKFKYALSAGEASSIEELKTVKIGEAIGPFGTVSVVLHYRTHFTPPERIPDFTRVHTDLSGDVLSTGPHRLDSELSSGSSLRSLAPPLLGTPTLVKHHSNGSSSTSQQPFSSFLPKPAQRLPSSEKSTPCDDGSLFSSVRQDSEETVDPVTIRSNTDGYLVLDLQPAFTAGDPDQRDVSELLKLCSDPPYLEMFGDGGMDVAAACNYLDANLPSSMSSSLMQH